MAEGDHVIVHKDFFHCSICLEKYETPRSLPCLHTFCDLCLTGYIGKLFNQSGTLNLLCPICRADTKSDNGKFKSVQKWVESFPINFTLLSILNESGTTMSSMKTYCEPCLREENKVDATIYCYDCSEKLCEDCQRHHKKSKSSASHKLLGVGENTNAPDFEQLEYLTTITKCPKHSSEEVKYLCKDHDQLCCNECAIVTHRKCDDMVSLAEEVKKKGDYANIQKRFEAVIDHSEKLTEQESKYNQTLATKEIQIKRNLKKFKKDIDIAYDKLESRLLEELSKSKRSLSDSSLLQKESVEVLKEDVARSVEKMKKTVELGTDLHVFLMEKQMGKLIVEYEKRIKEIHQETSKVLLTLEGAQQSQKMIKDISTVFQLQKVTMKPRLPLPPGHKDLKDRKATLFREFDLRETSHPRYCIWKGSCIVIAFETISKINVYNEDDGTLLSSYACPSEPTSMVDVENGAIAVAFPEISNIAIMKLERNRLIFVRQLVNSNAEMIAYDKQNKQLLTMKRPENIVRKFYLNGMDAGMVPILVKEHELANAINLAFDAQLSLLYISVHSDSKLFCVNMLGNLVFQSSIESPWGVTTDVDGGIYVVSWNEHEVQQFNKNGQSLKKIICGSQRVQYPMGISFNETESRMLITCYIDCSGTSLGASCVKLYLFE